MKAERRHELQTNTLDQALRSAPEAARKYGGMVLLVVLAIMAGYLLIRYRISSTREAQRVATENLATARTNITRLGEIDLFPVPAPQKAEFRKQFADQAREAIDNVSNSSNDPKLLAEALLARGDLNWTLAQLDELPGAATQPLLRLEADRKTLLGEAESAYDQVVTQYGDQKDAVIAAKFGLAAVAEQAGNWDRAKQTYQQIADDNSAAEAYRTQAKIRLENLAQWSQPVLLAAATQASASSGIPFLNAATTAPATQAAPAMQAAPATLPTTTAVEW